MPTTTKDRETLRALAARWREAAARPVMAERKRQWTLLKDLRPERPLFLFETATLEGYVAESELACQDPQLRLWERHLRETLRHAEEVGDDLVVEPWLALHWDIEQSDYGVPIEISRGVDTEGGSQAYHYNHPLRTPADAPRLRPRTRRVHRDRTLALKERLEELFGDLLPVEVRGIGSPLAAITSDLFRLIGNDNLLTWPYDAPEVLRAVVSYLRDDRLEHYRWLEREHLLATNSDSHLVGSGSPGFTTALPGRETEGPARLRDLWVWIESQETTMISPPMFADFFLPAMAEVASLFGLVYYGCCEPVHDRFPLIAAAIPHTRAVSVSPWCQQEAIAGMLGRTRVFSRKPKPWLLSGPRADWDGIEKDLDETLAAARDCCLEIICRDGYRIDGDRPRLRRWADLIRSRVGGAVW